MPAEAASTQEEPRGWYSYAVIRAVPRVERGEFINVGVLLFARTLRFLEARYELETARLQSLTQQPDIETLTRHLEVFRRIAAGDPDAGPMARMSQSERFHWLTSPSSTMIQTSEVHTGRCDDPAQALEDLMQRLVRT